MWQGIIKWCRIVGSGKVSSATRHLMVFSSSWASGTSFGSNSTSTTIFIATKDLLFRFPLNGILGRHDQLKVMIPS